MGIIDTLITDRAQADVNNLLALNKKISNGTATTEEVAEYAKANHRGAYNYTDLNRVSKAMEYLDNRLKQYGYHSGYDPIVIPRASVVVHAPSGGVVTMSKGGKVLTAEEKQTIVPGGASESEWYFTPPMKGEWTVTATLGDKTESSVVNITDAVQYSVMLGLNVARLPEEYQEAEYIQSNGTQYIDTGVLASGASLGWEIKCAWLDATKGSSMLGAFTWGGANGGTLAYSNVGTWMYQYGATSTQIEYNLGTLDYNPHIFKANVVSGEFSRDDETLLTGCGYSAIPNTTVYLFASHRSGETTFWAEGKKKIYYCKMYTDGALVRDFVPCYIKVTGEAGLYDLVSKAFFGNNGAGSFEVGPDAEVVA